VPYSQIVEARFLTRLGPFSVRRSPNPFKLLYFCSTAACTTASLSHHIRRGKRAARTLASPPCRCRENMAQVRQSRPDSGHGSQVQVLTTFEVVPSQVWVVWVGGDDGELRPWHYIYVYSIESRLIMRVRYDSHIRIQISLKPKSGGEGVREEHVPDHHLRQGAS